MISSGQNDRTFGFYRDRAILELVESCRCLNAEQVECLVFRGMKAAKRKCQQRLKKLTAQGKLQRWRYALEEPYAYYCDLSAKVEQMEHVIMLNWVYCWLVRRLKSWETLHSFEYEKDYGFVRADAFAAIKTVTGYKLYYVELDRASKPVDKVRKYNDLYESEKYVSEWWAGLTKRFPGVIIACANERRVRRFEESVRLDNCHGLEFRVCLINDLRKEVIA